MAAVGVMVLALLALVGAVFCFIAGGVWSWVALALFLASMALEGVGFALAETEAEAA
jgi:hypothetical protein